MAAARAKQTAGIRPTYAGPDRVKWIKITDLPGDTSVKKVYFKSSSGLVDHYCYFIVGDAASKGWVTILVNDMCSTSGGIYYDLIGGSDIVYTYQDSYSVDGGPMTLSASPLPVPPATTAPPHVQVANIRTSP